MIDALLQILGIPPLRQNNSSMPAYAQRLNQQLSPSQAQYPGMLSPGNIDLNNRPQVKNPLGGTSTVYSMGIEADGKHFLIPRVSDDGRILSEKDAVAQWRKSKKHLGIFDSDTNADLYAQQLHNQQAKQYGLEK